MQALNAIICEFKAKLAALGYSTIEASTGTDAASAVALFIAESERELLRAYFDLEAGNSHAGKDPSLAETKDICIDSWLTEWPPSPGDARIEPPPTRLLSTVRPSKRQTFRVVWISGKEIPVRNGSYLVRRKSGTALSVFENGGWKDGTPLKWAGVDWRLSKKREEKLIRDFHQGDLDAGIALVRHCYASRPESSSLSFGPDDTWGIRARMFARVIYNQIAWREVYDSEDQYLACLPLVPTKEARDKIERLAEEFWLTGDA
ncbi:hypothetical protein P3W85_37295 [Cupriavidus basilensis]|uniref:DUF4304 domain-containing protein n=1 Tax=Cupriavidus basilensis TaxID=68895 RepID=A0ABT6B0Z4_9BURK|nr:hypothetical protein [Cupriavidus basilensis]MDF3838550.1 hypothetical protein [Cupriavidus basilensis]